MSIASEEEFLKAKQELDFVNIWVQRYLHRNELWNSKLFLTDVDQASYKSFECSIGLNRKLQNQDARWATHLHEILHAYSIGYSELSYEDHPGWEEGVVEQFQRLLRPLLIEALPPRFLGENQRGSQVEVSIQRSKYGKRHPYNHSIYSLEAIRNLIEEPSEIRFYTDLINTQLAERPYMLYDRLKRMSGYNPSNAKIFSSLAKSLDDGSLISLCRR